MTGGPGTLKVCIWGTYKDSGGFNIGQPNDTCLRFSPVASIEVRERERKGPAIVSSAIKGSPVYAGDVVQVDVQVSDPLGVKGVIASSDFPTDTPGVLYGSCYEHLTLTSGTPEDGRWTGYCTIPASIPGGQFTMKFQARSDWFISDFEDNNALSFTVSP